MAWAAALASCGVTGDDTSGGVSPEGTPGVAGGPCYPNATCNAGLECSGGVCLDPAAVAGTAGAACYPNATCNAGLECQNGVCVLDVQPPEDDVSTDPEDGDVDGEDQDDARDIDRPDSTDAAVDPPDAPVGDGGSVSETIGPEGGRVAVGEGGSIDVPPGALSDETPITVTATTGEAPDRYVQFSPIYRFEPEGLEFDSPATVRIPVSSAPFGAAIYWSRRGQPGFERLATTFDDGFAVAQVSHFSEGFVGDDAEVALEERPVDCLDVELQGVGTYAPAAVRASFVVRHCDGVPMVQELAESNITILNDETGAPFDESLEGGGASAPARLSDILTGGATGGGVPTVGLFAVLSLDLSNSIVDAGATGDVVNAAQSFVDALVRDAPSSYRYQVAVQVFGRTDATRLVQNFTSDYEALTDVLDGLRSSPGLGTTNLYGAYGSALAELERRAATADIVDQTLLIVTDGRHEAGDFENQRAAALAAREAAAENGVDVYSVAVNAPPADLPFLEELATDPSFFDVVTAADEIRDAFERTAENLRRLPEATYVVGICTPVELGTAGFSVRVNFEGVNATGSATYDASGLTGNVSACEPERVADPCGAATCGPGYLPGFSCGSCSGGTCTAGTCICPPGLERCSAGCSDLTSSQTDCGACGNICPESQFCGQSRCVDPFRDDAFVRVRAGTFTMGSPTGEAGRLSEETQHMVTLTRDYLIQTTEVTQGQWVSVSGGTNPSSNTPCGNSCPVDSVDWYSAVAFTNALSVRQGLPACYTLSGCSDPPNGWQNGRHSGCTGATFVGLSCTGYRLPTESEWEYAARAGTTTATYRGNLSGSVNDCTTAQPNLDPIAWWCFNSGSRSSAAGTRTANAWGLYDILGNVFEWTGDWYGTYPGTATDPVGPGTGSSRVFRGGSFLNDASYARAARRNRNAPSARDSLYGFRLARTAP
jgi:formylglycine-generating enzyme required for sulfatase activity